PTGISSRDSLPPLNAMPVVQAPQAARRVLRKWYVANAEAPEMRAGAGISPSQNSPLFRGGVALLFQAFPPLAQNTPVTEFPFLSPNAQCVVAGTLQGAFSPLVPPSQRGHFLHQTPSRFCQKCHLARSFLSTTVKNFEYF
ncbi:hypothetical protein, partial [uncultured Mailhella sp.]|uniref:hypothetical protein n=1 Tax=uncultured Mailhella sp. TaxID=1981031 RepID=UPI0025EE0575